MAISSRHIPRSSPCLGLVRAVLILWGWSLGVLGEVVGVLLLGRRVAPPAISPGRSLKSTMPPFSGIRAHFWGFPVLVWGPVPSPLTPPWPGLWAGLVKASTGTPGWLGLVKAL